MNRGRLALLSLSGLALLAGLTGSLGLLGFGMPQGAKHLAAGHGLLMALGFLGTMIALERAVALGARWAYLSPLTSGAAGVSLMVGAPPALTSVLLLAGGLVFVAMYISFDRIEIALHTRIQAVGGLAWVVAALLALIGRPVSVLVSWLAAFLVLVIAGERLELSRLGALAPSAGRTFVGAVALFMAGVALSVLLPDTGMRLAGVGLLAITAWLVSHDLARRTVRMSGVTRFIALSLLIGYGWLAVAGGSWIAFGADGGAAYDVQLHAVFLGFVISMVFGHAPVIVPAVLRVPLPYRQRFYVHVGLLHIGLLVRVIGGDLLGVQLLWQVGGALNVAALLLFVTSSAGAALEGLAARRSASARSARASAVS